MRLHFGLDPQHHVVAEIISRIECEPTANFGPQAIANTLWAFAKAGVSSPELFKAIAVEAEKQVRALPGWKLHISGVGTVCHTGATARTSA